MGIKLTILARNLRSGMVMARSLDAGVFSIREVRLVSRGILPVQEVEIYGPLGILLKRDADSRVSILG